MVLESEYLMAQQYIIRTRPNNFIENSSSHNQKYLDYLLDILLDTFDFSELYIIRLAMDIVAGDLLKAIEYENKPKD